MRSDTGAAEPATRRTFVVVLGRTNYAKRSGLVDSVIRDLEAAGHIVRPFRPTEQWLDERFTASRAAGYCQRSPRVGPFSGRHRRLADRLGAVGHQAGVFRVPVPASRAAG